MENRALDDILGIGENSRYQLFSKCLLPNQSKAYDLNHIYSVFYSVNPLPHMSNSGSSNSAANKDIMAKIWTKGDTII